MKAKNKILLSSLTTIALSATLIAGSAFAFFTSESKMNIAVTSGKVNVTATVGDLTLSSYAANDKGEYVLTEMSGNQFELGGTATKTATGVSLVNIVPGDRVEFEITIKNESTIAAQYQTVVSMGEGSHSGLFNALNVEVDGEKLVGSDKKYSDWEPLADNAELTIPVTVELPYNYSDNSNDANSVQGKECSLDFVVSAAQSNAKIHAPIDSEGLKDAIGNAESGDIIYVPNNLMLDEDLEIDKNLTIRGEGNEKPVLSDVRFSVTNGAALTLDNLEITGDSFVYDKDASELTITNCKATGIAPTATNGNTRKSFITIGDAESDVTKLNIQNNEIVLDYSKDKYNGPAAIVGWSKIADGSVISGNTFGSEENPFGFVIIKPMNFEDGATLEISNNTFYGDSAGKTYCVDPCPNTSRANTYTVIYKNNTVYGNACLTDIDVQGTSANGQLQIFADNTVNGNKIALDDIERTGNSFNYVGVDVTVDANGKFTGGSFVARVGILDDLVAEGYEVRDTGTKSGSDIVYEIAPKA